MSHYMTEHERYKLEAYLRARKPVRWIAREMGFCRQTIYNEIRRGQYIHTCDFWDEVRYSADKAQQVHNYNQTAKGRPLKIGHHHGYARRLEDLMRGVQPDGSVDQRKRYSPYAALEIARREGFSVGISVNTLYRYIDAGVFWHLSNKDLWQKSKRKKRRYRQVQRVAHPQYPSIMERPQVINERLEPGHWEMDLVVGRKTSKGVFLTLTERQSRREIILKLPNRKADSVLTALGKLDLSKVKSITTDNGSEFLRWSELMKLLGGGTVYYCHSYAAWEKGTNEIHNRMIRRWYPKGTDISEVSQEELTSLADWMNGYPRRVLGGKTPAEAYHLAQALAGSSFRE